MFNHCFPSTCNSLFPGTLRTEGIGKVREITSEVHSDFLKFYGNKFLWVHMIILFHSLFKTTGWEQHEGHGLGTLCWRIFLRDWLQNQQYLKGLKHHYINRWWSSANWEATYRCSSNDVLWKFTTQPMTKPAHACTQIHTNNSIIDAQQMSSINFQLTLVYEFNLIHL